MVVNIQKNGNEIRFVLPPQAIEELKLEDGSAIEIRKAETSPVIRYATTEEVMEAHRKMEPFHSDAYRELAK